ncbi:hypothetical protein [Bradyrhizobium canariense]|uniref:Uncharacterized protein n=1 Tax=Bradyrhizobium canariense TaxID=255045 RepID=A0A1H1W259_9BRAD|nr:hypothetical protein [Bradyrhizobium canariense]SDS90800.1 hypothetical protein SAMN05444158_3642 [Bradyrhizobium canariense]
MLDDRTRALLLALLYPVQFDARPELGISRVLKQVVGRNALQATPSDYLRAIETALQSRDEELADIIPQTHSEAAIRSYLQQLSRSFVAAPRGGEPFARS